MPVIEYGDWASMQEAITSGNKAVSGMTAAEAQAALNAGQTATNSGNLYVYGSQNIAQTGGNVIQFPGTGASQAAGEYVSGGGLTNAGGAAVSSPASIKGSNMALTQTAAGTTGVAGLLAMNLPTAAAAIAPVAGVALGATLYSANPDFWEKISRALLPFCYEDTELLPVAVDENGTTYYPKEAIDAVKTVISEISTGEVPPDASQIEGLDVWQTPIRYITTNDFRATIYNNDGTVFEYLIYQTDRPVRMFRESVSESSTNMFTATSDSPYNEFFYTGEDPDPPVSFEPAKRNYEYNGVYCYGAALGYTSGSTAFVSNVELPVNYLIPGKDNFYKYWAISWAVAFDGELSYPEGISSWSGVKYPLNPEGIGVVTQIVDGQPVITQPYYPITTPVGDPGVSANPLEVPDPTKNPNPNPAINPWITPSPSPGTYPGDVPQSNPAQLPNELPNYDPNLDPNKNPSQAPEPSPDPDPEPAKKPGDSGTTPLPAIPIIPTLPSASAGLLHVYNPTQSQLDAFGSWLWTTFSGDLIDTISKLFNDPMDAVIGLHELYVTPSVSGSSTIRAGFLDSGVSSNLVGNRYTSINCGSIVVQEYYQNYLDYSPYTKCFIYLPFVGIVSVLADDIIGNAVNITYNIDSYTGCCIAVVTVAREGYSSTVYQFEGNCAVEIPITSGYQSTLMGAMLGIAGTAITGTPHVGLAASNLGRANLGKNDVSHSGSFGASYGAMGAKIPYIIVKRPTQKSVVNYNQEYGFPAHKRVKIGNCTGYLRAREVHVISPTATDDEKTRIEELLKEGVFVK